MPSCASCTRTHVISEIMARSARVNPQQEGRLALSIRREALSTATGDAVNEIMARNKQYATNIPLAESCLGSLQ